MADQLASGRKIRFLALVDNFSRVSPGICVEYGLKSQQVIDILEKCIAIYGRPSIINVDNGSEFTSKALDIWAFDIKRLLLSLAQKTFHPDAQNGKSGKTLLHFLDQNIAEDQSHLSIILLKFGANPLIESKDSIFAFNRTLSFCQNDIENLALLGTVGCIMPAKISLIICFTS